MIGMLYFALFAILFLKMGCSRRLARRQPADPGRRADRQRRDGLSTNHFVAYRRGQPVAGSAIFRAAGWGIPAPCNFAFHLPAHYHQRAHHLFP